MRHRRSNVIETKHSNPVTMVFGRPDIGAYLTETFAMQTKAPRTGGQTDRTAFGRLNDTSVSVSDMKNAAGLPGVQVRTRGLWPLKAPHDTKDPPPHTRKASPLLCVGSIPCLLYTSPSPRD